MRKKIRTIFKLLIIICFILSLSPSTKAQVRGGIKGGANFLKSNWEIPGLSTKYSGVSYHVGIFGNLTLTEQLLLQAEIQYNSFKIDYSGEFYTANYLSVPVVCGYTFLNNQLNIHAGPQLSLLLSAEPGTLETAIDNTELALAVGSGYTLKRFNFTARYIIGITNLASDEVTMVFPEATIRNSNFQLSVAYQIFGKN